MFTELLKVFWELWPDRVRAQVNHPLQSYFYNEGVGKAAIRCAQSKGAVGVTADPGLAFAYNTLCEDVGIKGEARVYLARRVFSDRLHLVLDVPPVE